MSTILRNSRKQKGSSSPNVVRLKGGVEVKRIVGTQGFDAYAETLKKGLKDE